MKILYGKHYSDRYKLIADRIKRGSSVLDVCCGDAELYKFLKKKGVKYLGVDINSRFISNNLKKGVPAKVLDIRKEEIPSFDYTVIQGSLYQFTEPKKIVNKLLKATNKYLIISEPIKNISNMPLIKNALLDRILTMFVTTDDKSNFRFTNSSFRRLLEDYKPQFANLPGKREIVAVIIK